MTYSAFMLTSANFIITHFLGFIMRKISTINNDMILMIHPVTTPETMTPTGTEQN